MVILYFTDKKKLDHYHLHILTLSSLEILGKCHMCHYRRQNTAHGLPAVLQNNYVSVTILPLMSQNFLPYHQDNCTNFESISNQSAIELIQSLENVRIETHIFFTRFLN